MSFSLKIAPRDLFAAFIAVIAVCAFVPILTYVYFAKDLESKEGIMNRKNTGLILLDSFDRPFFSFYEAKRQKFAPLSQIPKHTQLAVVAVEDKKFYSHPGFSLKAIVGALIADIKRRDLAYGGSTITQQLVKNSLLSKEKSFLRKVQEIVLAQELERRYSKDEILEMYLNSAYFGEGAFGVEEASYEYFGKKAKDLTLAQSSVLAAVLQAPSRFSPKSGDGERALKRQYFVLNEMYEEGFITKEQLVKTKDQKLEFFRKDEKLNSLAPHFALMVRDELSARYGEEEIARSGFKVKTTLDLDWQEYAEKVVKEQVDNLKLNNVSNASAVVIDPKTGEIKVMVGSMDWYNDKFGKVNIALASRQPGSAFKPLVYLAAFEKNLITPATLLKDEPITFRIQNDPSDKPYSPKNYDGKFRGSVLARRALANSLNVPSVEVMSKLGINPALDFAKRMGITTLKDSSHYGLSLVLGTGEVKLLELTNAYATIANRGIKNDPTAILVIKDKYDNEVYNYVPREERVVSSGFAFLISSILADNGARAEVFGDALTLSRPAAVKTGTTEDYKDAWTIGYTPSLTVGVWVGNNDGDSMDRVAGSLGAAPIWRALIEKFSEGKPIESFKPPSGVISVSVCKSNGLRLNEATSSGYTEYFIKGTEPKQPCFLPKPSDSFRIRPGNNQNKQKKEELNDLKNS